MRVGHHAHAVESLANRCAKAHIQRWSDQCIMPAAYIAQMLCHRGNTMRDAHLSIWAASAGAGLIWRDSGLHGLCQLSCLQIHLAPLPAPSTRLSQTCCQEVYHKELYICYLQQLPQLRPRALLCQACVSSSTKQDSGVVFRGVPYTALQASATAHAKNQGTCSNILGAVMLSIRRGRTGGPHRVDSARWR